MDDDYKITSVDRRGEDMESYELESALGDL